MEKFLVLEIAPHKTKGTFLAVDEDRNITIEKVEEKPDVRPFLASAMRLFERKLAARSPLLTARRVIAVADSSLATTIPVPLSLMRDQANIKSKITLAELENLIAQAMAKIFNGCRNEAARRLVVSELDAVLVGATTQNFELDERDVRSPVGYGGKKITLSLELVFAARDIFETLKPLFNGEEEDPSGRFFFGEAPQVALRALSRAHELPINLVSGNGENSSLYVFTKPKGEYPVLYREKLNWRFGSLTGKIKDAFLVSEGAADELYCLYESGKMSDAALRAFKKELEPAAAGLFEELARVKVAGPVYIDLPHPLPFPLPHKEGGVTLEGQPIQEILAGLGFTAANVARPILYFIEAYFDKTDSPINRKLHRRLHWLVRA